VLLLYIYFNSDQILL